MFCAQLNVQLYFELSDPLKRLGGPIFWASDMNSVLHDIGKKTNHKFNQKSSN